jgi:hypothetical protein
LGEMFSAFCTQRHLNNDWCTQRNLITNKICFVKHAWRDNIVIYACILGIIHYAHGFRPTDIHTYIHACTRAETFDMYIYIYTYIHIYIYTYNVYTYI